MANLTSKIPQSIWGLGFVTLMINLSGVIVFSLSPIYLTEILGVSMAALGILEGVVEGLSWIMRLLSGVLSDVMHRRKPFLFIAYTFTTLSRPIIAIATSVGGVFFARTIDRIGNGLQAPAREALVGDLAPEDAKGACYGLRQSLSVLGSVIGAVIIMFTVLNSAEDYRRVFWGVSLPPLLAILILIFFVKDKPKSHSKKKRKNIRTKTFKLEDIIHLKQNYWKVVLVGTLFMLANYSGAFMILQIKSLGLTASNITLVMVVQNIMTMVVAYPIGRLSDRIDRRIPLAIAFILTIIANLFLALSKDLWMGLIGVALWGLQIGGTQSLLLAKIADTAPEEVRGTSFGVYYIIVGFALFTANYISGWLSEQINLEAVFMFSCFAASLALVTLPMLKPQKKLTP